MSGLTNTKKIASRESGFSLIEVLIGLVLSGLLMSMVAMVVSQSITNNEVVRKSSKQSARMFTLRRIIHRDFQNINPKIKIKPTDKGFKITTAHNYLSDGAVEVEAYWNFSDGRIERFEENKRLEYTNFVILNERVTRWRVDFLDAKTERYINSRQTFKNAADIRAVKIRLWFDNSEYVEIIERVPYVV